MSKFALPALPYDYSALEPHIDTMTMNVHHKGHHQTYVNNLNGAIQGEHGGQFKGLSIENIQRNAVKAPDAIKATVRNNGGSANSAPHGDLKQALETEFGSVDEFKTRFNAAAAGRFGSGWAWLCMDRSGKLFICSTPNQDNPLMEEDQNISLPGGML
ncbi:Superoxide dismutase [Mn], mitochondrial [Galdieria sulphuraria]|nr:Superoxide dismutase [Mn], mitochondrial [Galdieria sulphuraria]